MTRSRTHQRTSVFALLSNLLRLYRGPLLFSIALVSWPAWKEGLVWKRTKQKQGAIIAAKNLSGWQFNQMWLCNVLSLPALIEENQDLRISSSGYNFPSMGSILSTRSMLTHKIRRGGRDKGWQRTNLHRPRCPQRPLCSEWYILLAINSLCWGPPVLCWSVLCKKGST